ncbi:hypothetical protein EUGRSUZ_C02587 [Eucalyptus grandis]|uniref:RNA polymerase II C-terminal domain phosphatase-like n=2 Tax=Eucalyptus grandis TaxID=71139 RepID=A0A059CRV5_EUCGR|nr:hypothetical protein EUGRSUZ_C02587 [Eucalyptus grandis]
MSLVTDSPVHSSSSDDFASYLDAQLGSGSTGTSGSSADDETDNESDHESERIKRRKAEKLEILEEPEGSTSHEYSEQILDSEQIVETTIKQDSCSHPGSFGGMCMRCGKSLEEKSGVTFGYIHKGLWLANDEIARLRKTDMKNLLRYKKLYLILDLDHTLLNSTSLAHISSDEEHLRGKVDSREDVSKGSLFILEHMHTMTKLRPFVRTFLKEASEMFEMYIYTMGDRSYALEMAKLLDPKREYFHERVISRDDGTQRHQKGLDVVLGQESYVLILDDTEQAWTKHKDNLLLMERYHYFASSCQQFGFSCKSLSEMETDENEGDGALATVIGVLKRVHTIFFHELEDELAGRDVRQVLKTLRKEVLEGCKIIFSRVFPTHFPARQHQLWKMAEQLGATCTVDLDDSVTHVVATDAGTEKSRWAVKEKKSLVHPRWIEASYYFWKRQPEESFSVDQKASS